MPSRVPNKMSLISMVTTVLMLIIIMVNSAIGDITAPDGTICGYVYDAQTNKPVPLAFVRCNGHTATPNAEGYYQIEGNFARSTKYNVTCYGPSYLDSSKIKTTNYNGKTRVDFYLQSTNLPPILNSLTPEKSSPQNVGTLIRWTADASGPETIDTIVYKFYLKEPSTGGNWQVMRDWSAINVWDWTPSQQGDYEVNVWVRDGKHAELDSWDAYKIVQFEVDPANQSPMFNYLTNDHEDKSTVVKGLNQFAGFWTNSNPNTRGVTALDIDISDGHVTVEAWGSCHPSDCEWGRVEAYAYASNVSDNLVNDAHFLSATWQFGFAETKMIIRLVDDDFLQAETFDHFTDDSGRTPYYATYTFRRVVSL